MVITDVTSSRNDFKSLCPVKKNIPISIIVMAVTVMAVTIVYGYKLSCSEK